MKRLALLVLVCLPVLPASVRAASPSPAKVLPRGSRVLKETRIAGYRHAVALAYTFHGPRVGVALLGTRRDRLVWSAALPATPRTLESPGPAGTFILLTGAAGSAYALSAYRLHSGHVAWALLTGKSRPITVAKLTVASKSLTVINPDTAHQGSVPYQFRTVLTWAGTGYAAGPTVHEPAIAPASYPVPNGVVDTRSGDTVLMKLETAWTLQEQEQGLMYRTSLDPDSGMVFVWPSLVAYTFTMLNTPIPLTVAFLGPDGTILDTVDMAANDSTHPYFPNVSRCVNGDAALCYQYAIEMNKGFFAANGIRLGDKVVLSLPCSSFPGFHSAYVKCYS